MKKFLEKYNLKIQEEIVEPVQSCKLFKKFYQSLKYIYFRKHSNQHDFFNEFSI